MFIAIDKCCSQALSAKLSFWLVGPGSYRDSLLIKGRRISDWRVIGPKQDICVKGSGPSRKGGCTKGGRVEAVRECHKGVFRTQHSCCKQKLIASLSTCIRITQGLGIFITAYETPFFTEGLWVVNGCWWRGFVFFSDTARFKLPMFQ